MWDKKCEEGFSGFRGNTDILLSNLIGFLGRILVGGSMVSQKHEESIV